MGVSDVNMEEGSLRMDANVSIRPAGTETLGTKTELKNMNSFRFLERGIAAEIARQEQVLRRRRRGRAGDAPLRPAVGRAHARSGRRRRRTTTATSPSRTWCRSRPPTRCSSAPARRFPSCPPSGPSGWSATSSCRAETARLLAFRAELGDFFESAVQAANGEARTLANWTTNELAARIGDSDPAATALEPAAFAELVVLVGEKKISASAGREVLDVLLAEGGTPAAVVEQKGLGRAESGELDEIVDRAIAENPDAVEKIRSGKPQAIGAIVGAVMRETKGRADGGEVQRMISEKIGA